MADRPAARQPGPGAARAGTEYVEIRGPVDAWAFDTAVHRVLNRPQWTEQQGPQRTVRLVDVGGAPNPVATAIEWMRTDAALPAASTEDSASGHVLFRTGPEHFLWYQRSHDDRVVRPVASAYSALLADRQAPAGRPSPSGGTAHLAAEDLAALAAVATESGATVLETLTAAFAAYAHRVTGDAELTVAPPVPRLPAGADPLAVRVDPDAGLGELAAALAAWLRADRRGRPRDERVLFGVAVRPSDPGLSFAGHPAFVRTAREPAADLALLVDGRADDGRLRLTIDTGSRHATGLEIATHLHRFLTFLRRGTAAPDLPIAHVELPHAGEPVPLRDDARGDMGGDVPPETVPGLFEAQAAAEPDRAALVAGDGAPSFAAVNRRANQLARLLVEDGAAPELYVGLLLPPGADVVAALLAVLKAGAGYLLLDPAESAAELARRLADCAPVVLLTSADLSAAAESAAGSGTIRVVVLDEPATGSRLAALADRDLTDGERRAPLIPQAPGCLLPSGEPEGVVIEHGGLVDLLRRRPDVLVRPPAPGGAGRRVVLSPSLSAGPAWAGVRWLRSLVDGHPAQVMELDGFGSVEVA